jgi:hypothetical protein
LSSTSSLTEFFTQLNQTTNSSAHELITSMHSGDVHIKAQVSSV